MNEKAFSFKRRTVPKQTSISNQIQPLFVFVQSFQNGQNFAFTPGG